MFLQTSVCVSVTTGKSQEGISLRRCMCKMLKLYEGALQNKYDDNVT